MLSESSLQEKASLVSVIYLQVSFPKFRDQFCHYLLLTKAQIVAEETPFDPIDSLILLYILPYKIEVKMTSTESGQPARSVPFGWISLFLDLCENTVGLVILTV